MNSFHIRITIIRTMIAALRQGLRGGLPGGLAMLPEALLSRSATTRTERRGHWH